jgi:hypothetical protein
MRKLKEYGRSPVLLRKTMPDPGQDVISRLTLTTLLSHTSHMSLENWVISPQLQVKSGMHHRAASAVNNSSHSLFGS